MLQYIVAAMIVALIGIIIGFIDIAPDGISPIL